MSQEPKRRHSRERKGKRRHSISLTLKKVIKCPNCSAFSLPHMACKKCGFYDGRQAVVIKAKKEKE